MATVSTSSPRTTPSHSRPSSVGWCVERGDSTSTSTRPTSSVQGDFIPLTIHQVDTAPTAESIDNYYNLLLGGWSTSCTTRSMREGHNLRTRRRMLRSGTSTRTTRRPRDHAGFGSPTRAVAEEDRAPMRMTGKGCTERCFNSGSKQRMATECTAGAKKAEDTPNKNDKGGEKGQQKGFQKASRKEKARDHLDLMMLWRMPRSRSRSIRLRPTLHRLLRVRRLLALVAWRPSWEMSRHC